MMIQVLSRLYRNGLSQYPTRNRGSSTHHRLLNIPPVLDKLYTSSNRHLDYAWASGFPSRRMICSTSLYLRGGFAETSVAMYRSVPDPQVVQGQDTCRYIVECVQAHRPIIVVPSDELVCPLAYGFPVCIGLNDALVLTVDIALASEPPFEADGWACRTLVAVHPVVPANGKPI